MDFSLVTNIAIPEGSVVKITDSLNRILWQRGYSQLYKVRASFKNTDSTSKTIRLISSHTSRSAMNLNKLVLVDPTGQSEITSDTYTLDPNGVITVDYYFNQPVIPSYAFYNDVPYYRLQIVDNFDSIESYAISGSNKKSIGFIGIVDTIQSYGINQLYYSSDVDLVHRKLELRVRELKQYAITHINARRVFFDENIMIFGRLSLSYSSSVVEINLESCNSIPLVTNSFYDLDDNYHIIVQREMQQSFKKDENWSRYVDKIASNYDY